MKKYCRFKESRLQQSCIKFLKSEGIYHVNVHGSGWSGKGTPDLITCINGRFIAFELKVEGNSLQTDQRVHKIRIERNKGLLFSPTTIDKFVEIIRGLRNEVN